MNFPPLNVNNLAIRHVNLPGLGPVFLVDNFGLVSAPNEYMAVNMIAGSISVQNRTPELSRVVATLIHSGIPALLGATNHAAYAIYKVGQLYAISYLGIDKILYVNNENDVKEVLQNFQTKFDYSESRVVGVNEMGEPLYVGFTALSQQTQNGYWTGCVGRMNGNHPLDMMGGCLPMQLMTTRIPAKPNSGAMWEGDTIMMAMRDVFGGNEKSEPQQRFNAVEQRLIKARNNLLFSHSQINAGNELGAFMLVVQTNPQDIIFTEKDAERIEAYMDFIETPADKLSSEHPLAREKAIDMHSVVAKARQFLSRQCADQNGKYSLPVRNVAVYLTLINTAQAPCELFIMALADALEQVEVDTKARINPVDDISRMVQIIGRVNHHSHPAYAVHHFPVIGIRNPNNASLSEMLQQIVELRRKEKESVLLNTTHFSITDVNDKVFVITDKTFGGSLTLHITDASQKESLLRRVNGLKELILEGRNALYYTDTILSAGENDFWKLTNTVISGPVKLVGKTILANTELRAGSYVDAMIENVK